MMTSLSWTSASGVSSRVVHVQIKAALQVLDLHPPRDFALLALFHHSIIGANSSNWMPLVLE